jgi:hypothetical protein
VPAGITVAGVTAEAPAGAADVDFVPLSVQPATAIDAMSRTTRPRVTKRYELRFGFMVFYHPWFRSRYTVFRHRIYEYI